MNPEQLRVESFATDAPPAGRGTVAAHAATVTGCQTDPPYCDTVMRAESCFSSCTDVDICTVFRRSLGTARTQRPGPFALAHSVDLVG